MKTYHKIQTVFKRDPENKYKTLLLGDFSVPEFAYLQENVWAFTEKVDGTNTRVMFDGVSLSYGGKTDRSQMPAQLANRLVETFSPLSGAMSDMFKDGACLYGEGYGAKIQKGGGNYRKDQDFVLFDVRVGDYWLQRTDVEAIACALGIEVVPLLGFGTLKDMVDRVRDGFSSAWGGFVAEGIVARPAAELKTRAGSRIITKLKHKDFAST